MTLIDRPWFGKATLLLVGITAITVVAQNNAGPYPADQLRAADSPAPLNMDDSDKELLPPIEPVAPSTPSKEPSPLQDAAVRNTISRLLPDATADEREIWFQQMRELPAGVIEDLLKLRQDMRQTGSPLWSPDLKVTSPLPRMPTLATPFPAGVPLAPGQPQTDSSRPHVLGISASELASLRGHLQEVQRWTHQNIHHAQTPGYRSVLPNLSVSRPQTSDLSAVTSLGVAGCVIDLRPGTFLQTGRPLDVAIEGSGWLAIATSAGERFTRYGRLIIDAEGRLAVPTSLGLSPITPEVQIGNDILSVSILPDGVIQGTRAGQTVAETIGQIQLVDFRDATQLAYAGDCWLVATPLAGPRQFITSGPNHQWRLHIGSLEQSNVDLKQEKMRADWLSIALSQLVDHDSQMVNDTPFPHPALGTTSESDAYSTPAPMPASIMPSELEGASFRDE